METEKFIPKQHNKARTLFRVIGPLFLLVGVGCITIAMYDFFTIQGFAQPKYFWLFFVAMPFLFIGFILTGFGFGSSVARYQSREYAPVAKDTFNYLAKETTSGVKNISRAIQSSQLSKIECHSCHQQNDIDAKFCDECGEKMMKSCHSCRNENDPEARFCDNCGTSLQDIDVV